jgi:hypothetical protein
MTGNRFVTLEARIPLAAAFELDGDDIDVAVVVGASSLVIDVDSLNLVSVNGRHHHHDTKRLGTKHGRELI